jgi:hypothetical protein
MTTQGHDAYVRTTRTLERLCRDYGFEYVLGVFSNDMPDHRRMRAASRCGCLSMPSSTSYSEQEC